MRLVSFAAPLVLLGISLAAAEVRADAAPVAAPAIFDALAAPAAPAASIAPAPAAATFVRGKKKRKKRAARQKLVAPERLPEAGVAFSTGIPLRWKDEDAAFSLSYGFARHFAVRVNAATYKAWPPISFESEVGITGRNKDVGVGLVLYPRSLWSGPTFELGVFARDRDVDRHDPNADRPRQLVATDTAIYAGRGLFGWSWYWDPFFLSVAIGLSIGYERGDETSADEFRDMVVEKRVHRMTSGGETYFRMGFAFGN